MRFLANLVKSYPITSIIIVAIWVLCLLPIPQTPLSGLTLIDKWTHIVMYLALSLIIGYERWRNNRKRTFRAQLFFIFILPVIMGGLLEILQATATGGRRSGEWLDFVADVSGSALALLICILLARCLAKD